MTIRTRYGTARRVMSAGAIALASLAASPATADGVFYQLGVTSQWYDQDGNSISCEVRRCFDTRSYDPGGLHAGYFGLEAGVYAGPEANGTILASASGYAGDATSPDEGQYFFSRGSLANYFAVRGPEGAAVPIAVHASGYADSSGQGYATAEFGFGRPGNPAEYYVYASAYNGTRSLFGTDGNVDLVFAFVPNVEYYYYLDAYAGFAGFGGVFGDGHGFVDPTFTIDPAYADRYYLDGGLLSSPPTAVPEPASWALMLAGFGVVGSAVRRRRADFTRGQAAPTRWARHGRVAQR